MLDQILNAAIETQQALAQLDNVDRSEWRHVPPGQRRPQQQAFTLMGRRPVMADVPAIPGAKPIVARLFAAAPYLTILGSRIEFKAGGVDASIRAGSGAASLIPFCELIGGDRPLQIGQTLDRLASGEPIEIGQGRTLRTQPDRPWPVMVPETDGSLTFRFPTGTVVTQGRFTARLNAVVVFDDRAVVDVEWKLLGLDLADDPVVWWGD